MTTVAELADRTQDVLADAGEATWTQAQIEAWVVDALKEYILFFDRLFDDAEYLVITPGQYEYALRLGDASVNTAKYLVAIEYPVGESPPNYLLRKSYKDPDFREGDYYDVEFGYADVVGVSNADLMIGNPGSGGNAFVVYSRYLHHFALQPFNDLETPTYHEYLLILYVRWVAWINLASREMQNPTSDSSMIMTQMNENAHVARAEYLKAVKLAIDANTDGSARISWSGVRDTRKEIY